MLLSLLVVPFESEPLRRPTVIAYSDSLLAAGPEASAWSLGVDDVALPAVLAAKEQLGTRHRRCEPGVLDELVHRSPALRKIP